MLPNEVFHNIFSFLQPNIRRKGFGSASDSVADRDIEEEAARQLALSCLSRASKQFYQLAIPFLYHTIPKVSNKLLGVLSHNVSLAARIKAIDLCTNFPGSPPAVLLDAFEAAHSRFNLSNSFKNVLFEAIHAADQDTTGAEQVLYLLLLPNVETIEYCSYWHTDLTVMELFANVPRTNLFQEVRIRHYDTEGTARIADIHRLLAPTVEKLRGWALSWEMTAGDQAWGLELLPRLRYIELVEGVINDVGLADMLARCPGLRVLHITWGSPIRDSNHALDFTRMGEALRRHGAIERLVWNCLEDFSYCQGDAVGRLGSLRELTRLRVLIVPQDVLIGDDDPDLDEGEPLPLPLDQVLPVSIERLRLLSCQDDEEELDKQVVSLIRDGSPFTSLRRIQMKRSEEFSGGNAEEFGFELFHNRDKMVLTKKMK